MAYILDRADIEPLVTLTIRDDDEVAIEDLTYATGGLTISWKLPTDTNWSVMSLVSGTIGTWIEDGFAEDPGKEGRYQLSLPAGAVAPGKTTELRIGTSGNNYRFGYVAATAGSSYGLGQRAITVKVRDGDAGAIAGASVTVRNASLVNVSYGTTDASGNRMFALDDGSFTLLVSATDYDATTAAITVSGDADETVTLADAAAVADEAVSTLIRLTTAVDWSIPFVIGDLTTYNELRFTMKRSPIDQDDDDEAECQVKLTSGGHATDGLNVIAGETTTNYSKASITITDAVTGTGYITVNADATELVEPTQQEYWSASELSLQSQLAWRSTSPLTPPLYHWDVKKLDGSGSSSLRVSGIATVDQAVTQDVV